MSDTNDTPKINDVVWFDPVEPYSPEIVPDPISPHMAFNCVQAENPVGKTQALYAGYNLGWPYTELYGGQLPAPINIVAINAETGATYFAPSYFSLDSIQKSVRLLIDEAQIAAGEPVNNRMFLNGWFNVDLATLLRLPPDSAAYSICLWLDDLVTPIQTVQVPSNTNRSNNEPYPQFYKTTPTINIGKSSNSPSAEKNEIRTDGPLETAGGRIFATLPDDALGVLQPGPNQPPPVLSILGFTQKTRRFYWYSDPAFYNKLAEKSAVCFDFNPFDIIEQPGEPENVFVVTVLGNLRSESLWIPSEYFS